MMDEKLIGTGIVIAQAFNGKEYQFTLNESNRLVIDLPSIGKIEVSRILIKPDFWLIGLDNFRLTLDTYLRYRHMDSICSKEPSDLIKNYLVDPNIVDELAKSGVIMYSREMAELYDLPNEFSYDLQYNRSAFKWAKKKGKILEKQKQGIFN